jgi:hypothetical protein
LTETCIKRFSKKKKSKQENKFQKAKRGIGPVEKMLIKAMETSCLTHALGSKLLRFIRTKRRPFGHENMKSSHVKPRQKFRT